MLILSVPCNRTTCSLIVRIPSWKCSCRFDVAKEVWAGKQCGRSRWSMVATIARGVTRTFRRHMDVADSALKLGRFVPLDNTAWSPYGISLYFILFQIIWLEWFIVDDSRCLPWDYSGNVLRIRHYVWFLSMRRLFFTHPPLQPLDALCPRCAGSMPFVVCISFACQLDFEADAQLRVDRWCLGVLKLHGVRGKIIKLPGGHQGRNKGSGFYELGWWGYKRAGQFFF